MRRAQKTQDSSHSIAGESLLTVFEGSAAKLPKLDSLKRTIHRERERVLAAPAPPPALEELNLPSEYQRRAKGELYDSGSEAQRILIFGTQSNLDMLEASQVWLADGTFKTAPSHLPTCTCCMHGLRRGAGPLKDCHLLPSLFVLLANKPQATYTRMWQQIRLLCSNGQPSRMLMDIEKAAINNFQHTWPAAVVKYCFFHLT